MSEDCIICGKPVPDYTPKFCCNGRECGCMGQPVEPCVCSKECGEALFSHIGVPFEDRRIKAGIQKYEVKP
jgi:hypothetical protein